MITFAGPSPAMAAEPIDVVFDLDWTLIYPTNENMALAVPKNTFKIGNNLFRLTDHAVEILLELHQQPDVRISFFSGGARERNTAVVKIIYDLMNKPEYRPHKILSFEDLTVISTDKDLKFAQRNKKDIGKFFNLQRAMLVDDIEDFILPGQEQNEKWLGKTYNDRPKFELQSLEETKDAAYSAPNFNEWLRERNKLVTVKEIILKTLELTRQNSKTFVENLQSFIILPGLCAGLFSP
ncbi:MAG: hypothetical protein H7328_10735 [Bdellovibrio sp.]|nr:hypothetical protein [Bdellovibrio sp.]